MTITETHPARYYINLNLLRVRLDSIKACPNPELREKRLACFKQDLGECYDWNKLDPNEHQHLVAMVREVEAVG
ncbi:hypothetical protein [Alkalicoccus luteus]|uniref:Uncharacterized protein n=1 Tax=Alkalicoccus luteus TaxID=1237094 RepID=A0A969PSJ6_9BACI|nr:hypothetical protein [Alkalicoccus luteus]NJP37158.1 hypothetical protein [Alkalicoccus luteus]